MRAVLWCLWWVVVVGGRVGGGASCFARYPPQLHPADSSCPRLPLPHPLPSHPSVSRYVVADTGDALVVAFLGTKHPADHLVNLHLRHARLFPKRHPGTAGSGSGKSTTEASGAAAHGGYLRRAAGIPVEQLYQLARVQGKRLILAGALSVSG